ncbi:hypothetical protein JXQ70_03315 [bacterium]|nr:hypothetical protein [bacterium]
MDRKHLWRICTVLVLMTVALYSMFLLFSCTGDDDDDNNNTTDDYPPIDYPDPPWYQCSDNDEPDHTTVVVAMENVDQYFNGDEDNRRTVDAQVDFPTETNWAAVFVKVELNCPADGDCDNWDRMANIYLVKDPDSENEEVVELWRYITPFDIPMCMIGDVTAFAPYLQGRQTIRSYISTWVGPDFQSEHGHGWRITIKFIFYPGEYSAGPNQIVNLWPFYWIIVGNPDNPISAQIGNKTCSAPSTVSKAEIRLLVTGHGQGNLSNCAEFCHLNQVLLVNNVPFTVDPWRSDCKDNPIGPDQHGTWKYSRAGWCPGAVVLPHVLDITSAMLPGQNNTFEYQVWNPDGSPYENTCRPSAGDEDNHCEGCQFDQDPGNCDYNSTSHTEPNDQISVQVFIWE